MTQVLAHVAPVAESDESLADLFARVKRWGNVRRVTPEVQSAVLATFFESQRVTTRTKEVHRAAKGGRR